MVVDRIHCGDRPSVGKDYTRKLHSFSIPHFSQADAIYAKDLVGVRGYGVADEAEMLANKRIQKMERIARNGHILMKLHVVR